MLSNVIEHLTGILSSSRDEGGAKAARQKLEETFSYPSITSLLPYREYDEKSDLFINSRSVGFIMEVAPSPGPTSRWCRRWMICCARNCRVKHRSRC
jgi:conjugal transfer ATP-binding protein TraC